MPEIHYIERVPRRSDFCGCPPCPICYNLVFTDDQEAPTFQEKMKEIYGEGPMPQNEQEYEWAHVAAHQCRQELKAPSAGDFFADQDRAKMTQGQIDDLLKTARKAAVAPKPLNTVNLDDMPAETISRKSVEEQVAVQKSAYAAQEAYMAKARANEQQVRQKLNELANNPAQVMLQDVWLSTPNAPGKWSGGG